MPRSESIFDFVDNRLTLVSYTRFTRPIEVPDGDDSPFIKIRLRPESFRIPLPPADDIACLIHELVDTFDELTPETPAFDARVKEYEDRLHHGPPGRSSQHQAFAKKPQYPEPKGTHNAKFYRVFARLKQLPEFREAQVMALRDYLTNSGFGWNGTYFAARRFFEYRGEKPALEIELQRSDCYTYRVIGALVSQLADRIWQGVDKPELGEHLTAYMGDDARFQRNLHNGIGLDLMVHTITDNKVLITKRSKLVENSSGSGGKLFESVCEGLDSGDIDTDSDALRPLSDMIRRALKEEVIGADDEPESPLGRELLNDRIERRCITGCMLYKSNLSLNLCGLVSIACSVDELKTAFRWARDGRFEHSIFDKRKHRQVKIDLPDFSKQGIEGFIRKTVGSKPLRASWDESALVTLICALSAVGKPIVAGRTVPPSPQERALLLILHGPPDLTLEQIAQESDIHPSTIYRSKKWRHVLEAAKTKGMYRPRSRKQPRRKGFLDRRSGTVDAFADADETSRIEDDPRE